MSCKRIVLPLGSLILVFLLCINGEILFAQAAQEAQPQAAPKDATVPTKEAQGPAKETQGPEAPPPSPPIVDPVESLDKRLSIIEEWKAKIERLPSLSNKFNAGLNALQFLYSHQEAHVAEGKSQDNLSIRRSEMLFYGKINEYIPKWHALYEFQSISLANNTPGCAAGSPCNTQPVGTAISATFFRESYIDFRPLPSIAPNLNFIRMGIFRMPFGIFTETSGGLRDVISSPYLTSVGSGTINRNGSNPSVGTIEFIHERDYFADVRGTLFNRVEYVGGIMNNNNFEANAVGANGPKVGYGRIRFLATDISFISFTMLAGESNNTNTQINGRGKGAFDRYGVDFRYTSRYLPGLMMQGEYWQGHDGANQTSTGIPAQGACLNVAQCGGNAAPGVMRRTWYVLSKYFISNGPLQNWEPVVMYEQFDPDTRLGNDLYTRTIVGVNYYFENLPPKIQTKLSIDYEFRHHSGFGPGTSVPNTDPFAQNAFFVQFQVRYQ
ncbi:MAG TPA: hypothetical protein VL261_02805 [Nitrospira sp.]|jgi:hypothetical protein|nr:hypothetical protein [Nitrospira sp.]